MTYLTVKEAADKWGYSEATIRKWCRQGIFNVTVRAIKENGHWKIPEKAQCPKPRR